MIPLPANSLGGKRLFAFREYWLTRPFRDTISVGICSRLRGLDVWRRFICACEACAQFCVEEAAPGENSTRNTRVNDNSHDSSNDSVTSGRSTRGERALWKRLKPDQNMKSENLNKKKNVAILIKSRLFKIKAQYVKHYRFSAKARLFDTSVSLNCTRAPPMHLNSPFAWHAYGTVNHEIVNE